MQKNWVVFCSACQAETRMGNYGKPGKIEFSKRPSSKEGKIQKQYICVIF